MLEYTLCNELLAEEGTDLGAQARIARDLGYVGLELAPYTLGPAPEEADARAIRKTVEDAGMRITGLHWLLSHYPDASITDPARQAATRSRLLRLLDLCAALGGEVIVHGSPANRRRPPGMSDADLVASLAEFFAPLAARAGELGLSYCIEPLAEAETIGDVGEGAALVRAVGHPAFRTMIDCSAAGQVEPPVADLIRRWVPEGVIGHIHANDTNRGAPGMGTDPFHNTVAALIETGWSRPIGIEPFRTLVDARVTAATGIATLRACEGALR
ncbi:sugar phosphate isomerase/epimerase [Palleronia aestuarii]|uniref:Sugar phosphate isomerase/epimerase n=1 Tax=Palleronia aestuarii TaxID=568105 RepID=A0A2W7NUN1_9RHOB|nr:sugar phosphate isomerase/epimerase [Palleronia aestuarii]PZX17066.1 sugar phosphate isomerase/epimerase [Palleronia aestuarii]